MIYDLLIIGAGPAGLSAAITATSLGAAVLVADENLRPGGQLIKQTHKFFGSKEHSAGERGFRIGEKLLEQAMKSGCTVSLNTRVYNLLKEDGIFTAVCIANGKETFYKARAAILAAGASENSLPFEGWTLPGVITAGAAQTMVNINKVLPGRKMLMIGSGNVGLIVAYQMLQAGMEVAAVLEAAQKVGGYEVHAAKLRRANVPVLTGCTILKANGRDNVEWATICEVDDKFQPIPATERKIEADTVCIAVGLSPLYQLVRLAGAQLEYSAGKGGFVPVCDENLSTTLEGLYAAGDITAIEEASIAIEEGKLAALSACVYLGLAEEKAVLEAKERYNANLSAIRMESHTSDAGTVKSEANCLQAHEKSGIQVVTECTQNIPCNPCESACPTGALKVGRPISNMPEFQKQLCIGCLKCVEVCPGLAVFVINYEFNSTEATVAFAYEYLPLPGRGDKVMAVDRNGKVICVSRVIDIKQAKDRTNTVKIAVPKDLAAVVRGIEINAVGGSVNE